MKMLQKCLITLLALCSINFGLAQAAFAHHFDVVFPAADSKVYAPEMHLIARVFDKSPLDVIVDGVKKTITNPVEMKSKDKTYYMVMTRIRLKQGMNTITLQSSGEKTSFTVEYVTSASAFRDGEKEQSFFHMGEKSKICLTCHKFAEVKDCMQCHKEKAEGEYVHGPVAAWMCMTCHDSNNYFATPQPVVTKCLQCHKEFTDKMYSAEFAHGPTVAGYCTICHSPHTSQERFMLREKVNNICSTCHEDKKSGTHVLSGFMGGEHPTSGRKIPGTNQEISCVSCHNPHFGSAKQLYVNDKTDFTELCMKCHTDKF